MLEKFKNKKIYIILIILMVVAVISIGSYALLLWSSEENTEMTLRIGDFAEVIFPPLNEDTDPSDGITISGNQVTVSNMGPVFDYEKDGEILEFSIISLLDKPIVADSKLHITSISDNLKSEDFKLAVLHSTDKETYTNILNIDFTSASNDSDIDLFSGLEITDKAFFKVIFYIDGNMLNDNSIQGGSLSGYITVDAEKEVIGDLLINNFAIPTSAYAVDTSTCTDATMTYDYTLKGFKVSNVSLATKATCTPTVTSTTRTYFNNYIISLLNGGTSVAQESVSGDGSTLEKITDNGEVDYRYRGINPTNYVWFNNELWRIIGVFDSNSHGISGSNLVKLIRDDSIGGYVWDNAASPDTTYTYGSNNYLDSDMYQILNTAYYNHVNGTGQDYCYADQTSLPGKCDFTEKGIQDEYKSMVEESVIWYLGGYTDASVTSSAMYGYERSGEYVYTGDSMTNDKTTSGTTTPIGLMYASDYGYASPSSCTSSLGSYSTSGCANKNWLKSNYYEWTLTHYSDYSYIVFHLYYTGTLNNTSADTGYATRPVLYLDSSVYYLSGTGLQTDPYIIAID